jgi:DNA helicase-2/ATP-dependent DNA helicase PcrA
MVLEQVLAVTGYEQYLAEEGPEGVERLENVRELIAGAAEWAEVQDATAGEDGDGGGTALELYLTQAALLTPTDEAAAGPGVTLMTMHMAKGLEWAVVALAGLEDGLFPLARSAGQPGGLEEERRLCYVGLTRAREKLYLSWARTRYRNGRLDLAEPSRFLEAVPPEVLLERNTTPSWDRSPRGPRARRARRAALSAIPEPWMPAEESQDAPRYVQGERVRHRKFGGGVVRAVAGQGKGLKVTVEFDDQEIGTKQLLVAYAGLERDWEGGEASP